MFSPSGSGCDRIENQVFALSALTWWTAALSFTTMAMAAPGSHFRGAARVKLLILRGCSNGYSQTGLR